MENNHLNDQIVQSLRKNLTIIAAYGIGSFVYGSVSAESDYDLAVVVEDKKATSEDNVYEMLRSVSFPRDLDLSVVDRQSSPLFLYQVISKGKRVYERNRRDMMQFEAFVLHNYYDTAHLRAIYAGYLREKFSGISYAN